MPTTEHNQGIVTETQSQVKSNSATTQEETDWASAGEGGNDATVYMDGRRMDRKGKGCGWYIDLCMTASGAPLPSNF